MKNLFQEARRRFELDRDLKRRQQEEKQEAEDRRKREIYLNGGYLDCVTPGCAGRVSGSTEGEAVCAKCAEARHQRRVKEQAAAAVVYHGKSKFYLPASSSGGGGGSEGGDRQDIFEAADHQRRAHSSAAAYAPSSSSVGSHPDLSSPDEADAAAPFAGTVGLRVKLPPPTASSASPASSSPSPPSAGSGTAAGAVRAAGMCRNEGCYFFGTPELDNFCSQCYRLMGLRGGRR